MPSDLVRFVAALRLFRLWIAGCALLVPGCATQTPEAATPTGGADRAGHQCQGEAEGKQRKRQSHRVSVQVGE